MRPMSTVDKPSFKNMLDVFSMSSFKPVCRQTLSKQISSRMEKCKHYLMKLMENQDFVCTTADIWSKNNKSFFGVTL